MLRQLLTYNISDPLSDNSRGFSRYTQNFSGTGLAGQLNYLERKPSPGGALIVNADGFNKVLGTDFTFSSTTGVITWTGYTPLAGSDNIIVTYDSIKLWVYDDAPAAGTAPGNFPRITVEDIGSDYQDSGFGTYVNYNTGVGDLVTTLFKIIVRGIDGVQYDYQGIKYKNAAIAQAIAENIKNYINSNRIPSQWRFWDWRMVRAERVRTEEDQRIHRYDVTVEIKYFDKESGT